MCTPGALNSYYWLQIWYAALYRECRSGAQIIFPESGRGLGHVTPTIFGIRSNISAKLLELETWDLVRGFVWGMSSGRTKIPQSGRGLRHVTLQLLAYDRTNFKTIWASDFKFGKQLWLPGSAYHSLQWGSTVGYPSDSLGSCQLLLPTDCQDNFPSTVTAVWHATRSCITT